jgi:hypothetical protein
VFRDRGIRGTVVAAFVVDTGGIPEIGAFRVHRTDSAELSDSLRVALAGLRYEPARTRGCRVRQLVQETFRFQ